MAPWSAFWEHNRFAELHRTIEVFVSSPYIRGAVSGIGVVTVIAGLAELASAIVHRRREAAGPTQTGS